MNTENEQISVAAPIRPPQSAEGTRWPYNSIFRAPAHIRYSRGSDLEPKLVSIGPYYHGRVNLKPMEDLKLTCMSDLLKMRPVGGSNVDEVPVDEFMTFLGESRAYYKAALHYEDDDFVKMLIRDSCFIIRIILSFSKDVQESMHFLDGNLKEIRSDLLLLENQIPLFFVRRLHNWLFPNADDPKGSFGTFLEPFLFWDMPWRINHGGKSDEAAHLLDLYWRCSSSPKMIDLVKESRAHGSDQEQPSWSEIHILINEPKVIANATVLHQKAGIIFQNLNQGVDRNLDVWSKGLLIGIVLSFKQLLFSSSVFRFLWRIVHRLDFLRTSRPGNLDVGKSTKPLVNPHQKPPSSHDVTFCNGIIRMPCLKIDSSQTTLFVNLMDALKSIIPSLRTVSSYMKLMDALIDSRKDVEFLQQCGIISNMLSSHEMAATFFNDIGNFCLIDYNAFMFSDLYENVQKYYDSFWNHSRASLRYTYFSSPWAIISVGAGALLLFLAAIQTYFTVFPKK